MNISNMQAKDRAKRAVAEALDFESEEISLAELMRRINVELKKSRFHNEVHAFVPV